MTVLKPMSVMPRVTLLVLYKDNYAETVDKADDFKPQEEELTNTENVSMYHRYIQTPLDPQHETFEEAIKVEHYVKNECWFNTLTDYHKDTLMKLVTLTVALVDLIKSLPYENPCRSPT